MGKHVKMNGDEVPASFPPAFPSLSPPSSHHILLESICVSVGSRVLKAGVGAIIMERGAALLRVRARASGRDRAAESESSSSSLREERLRRHTGRSGYGGGRSAPLAGQYHSSDFDYEEHALNAGRVLLEKERGAGGHGWASTAEEVAERVVEQGDTWERFHRKVNSTARFFKEKRYILQEFPGLLDPTTRRVCEFGCGNGSSVVPVLKGNPAAHVTALDFSPSAVEHTRRAVEAEGFEPGRFAAMVRDLSSDPVDEADAMAGTFDAVLMVFMLSAVPPEHMDKVLRNALALLKPGGRAYFRDYGRHDLTQLRFPLDQRLGGGHWYQRKDGTLSYFFDLEDLKSRFEGAGFACEEADYVCVELYNRKKDEEMRRVFCHGVFVRPED